MLKQILQVGEFHELTQRPTRLSPVTELPPEEALLCKTLLTEDLAKLLNATTSPEGEGTQTVKPALALEALTSQFYHWCGTVLTYGLMNYIPKAFAIIHESNMSKLWSEEQLKELPPMIDWTEINITPAANKRYLVTHDNDIIPSPTFIPALPQLLEMMEEVVGGQDMMDFNPPVENRVHEDYPELTLTTSNFFPGCSCSTNSEAAGDLHHPDCSRYAPF